MQKKKRNHEVCETLITFQAGIAQNFFHYNEIFFFQNYSL